MNILLSGSTGLVGSALLPVFSRIGLSVTRLVRSSTGAKDEVRWNALGADWSLPETPRLDAVVHLAGENIAAGRWTAVRKQALWDSRVLGTRSLVRNVLAHDRRPSVFVSASAVGYYGDRGEEGVTEEAAPGEDFLGRMASAWEGELTPLTSAGIRVVVLRFGVILSPRGGALAKMLPLFRFGLGAPLGSGAQWMSWVALEDAVQVVLLALQDTRVEGPVNVVSPHPVTNRDFTKLLAARLRRPVMPAVPPFMLRLLLGEMADAALLASVRALPKRLQALSYRFHAPELGPALDGMLQDP